MGLALGGISHFAREVNLAHKAFRTLHQDSPVDEFDRAFSAHRVQAHGNTLAGRPNNGSNLTVRQRDVDQTPSRSGTP